MSQRGVGLWLGVAILTLGAGAWWLLGEAGDGSRDSASLSETDAALADREPVEEHNATLPAPGELAEPQPLSAHALGSSELRAAVAASELETELAPRFELAIGAQLSGHVITTDGVPLPDARVVLRLGNVYRDRVWHEQPEPVGTVLADETGAFALNELPDGKLKLRAELDGWVCVQRVEGEIAHHEEVDGVELIMAPTLSVPGFVRDARGASVAGAEIVLNVPDTGPSRISSETLAAKLAHAGPLKVEASSDALGAFTLEAIAAGTYDLSVQHDEHPTLKRQEQIDGRALHLQLEDGVALAGIVYGADGDPLPGTSVRLRSGMIFGPGKVESRETTTDEDGAFRLAGLTFSDSAYVMLLASGHAVHVVQPQPLDAKGTTVVEYDLAIERVIAGVLRDTEGTPIEGIELKVQGERVIEFDVGMHPIPTWEQRSGLASSTTNAEGRFRLGQLYEGTFQLALYREGELLSVQSVASGGEDLELELDLASFGNVNFTGRVSDAISGFPVARFKLHVWRPNFSGSFSGSPREFEDSAGRYELRELNPGLMYVSAETDGYHRASSAKLEYEAGEHVIDLALSPHRDLQLRVLRPDGSPVSDAKLGFHDDLYQMIMVPVGPNSRTFMVSTNERGEAHVFELPAAPITVTLTQTYGNEEQSEAFDLTHPLEGVQTIFLDDELTSRPTRRDVHVMLMVLADDRPADLASTKREDFLGLQAELTPRFAAGEFAPLARSIALTFTSASGDVVEYATYGKNAKGQWRRLGGASGSSMTSEMPGGVSWDVPVGAGTLTLDIDGKGQRVVELPDGSDELQAMLFFAEP